LRYRGAAVEGSQSGPDKDQLHKDGPERGKEAHVQLVGRSRSPALAKELMLAIIGILHFNKKVDVTNALLWIFDSLAFWGLCHTSMGCRRSRKRKLLVRAKNNLAQRDSDKTLCRQQLSRRRCAAVLSR
jgi:hypothetical protein